MNELLAKIEGLEATVNQVLERFSALKEENEILRQKNSRLDSELNKLRKSSTGKESIIDADVHNEKDLSNRQINLEQLKNDLDKCIEEVQFCLEQV